MSDLLDSLNGPQREAVLDFSHPLLVLAGAGSGKTRVITSKIAYAIKELGYKPWQILAVTFTNKAAKEMRERVEKMLEGLDIKGLELRTFHSLGAMLLRRYGTAIGLAPEFNIYDDEDSLQLLSSLYPIAKKQELRPYMKAISKAKDRSLDPDSKELDGIALTLSGFRSRYRAYERALISSGCVDFADLIVRTNELLSVSKEVRESLQNRFRLILVDEYQDSNAAQFRMLENLTGPKTQVVVVGDDDQSIYRFRGAEIKNIMDFPKVHPQTRTIKLEQNYRSTVNIVSLAASVIKNNINRHDKTIFTENEKGMLPVLFSALSARDEALRCALLIQSNRNYNSTAILYRTNAQSLEFETAFTSLKIPYQLIGALRFYDREEVKDVLSIIAFVLNPKDQISFSRIINKPARGIGAAAREKIISISPNLADALSEAISSSVLSGKAKSGAEKFLALYNKAVKALDDKMPSSLFATMIIDDFGIRTLYESESDKTVRENRLENLSALISAISECEAGREGLISFLETVTLDTTVLGSDDPSEKEGVKLMTMHNTKGLEFDRVFVTGLEDQLIPGNRSDITEDDIEEERRIFYVAVTRARKELYLSYSESRMVWGQWTSEDPSRFLREIPKQLYNGTLTSPKASYTKHYSFTPRTTTVIQNQPSWASSVSLPKKVEQKPVVIKKVNWKVGDRVLSPDYGKGTIFELTGEGTDRVLLKVKYDSGKVTKYIAKFANLIKME